MISGNTSFFLRALCSKLALGFTGVAVAAGYTVRVPLQPASHAPSAQIIQLGELPVGVEVQKSLIFMNRGADSTVVGATQALGLGLSVLQDECSGKTLPTGASCLVKTGFTPQSLGAVSAVVAVPHSNAGIPDTFTLRATGIDGSLRLTFNPSYVDFGHVPRGTSSAPRTVQVTNEGALDVWVLDARVFSGAPAFQVVASDCEQLAAGDRCLLTLQFSPSSIGFQQGSAAIELDNGSTPSGLSLAGSGVQAEARLSPSQVNFVGISVGTPSAPQTARLTNTGLAPLGFVRPLISGSNAFAVAGHDCPPSLAPGAGCDIEITATVPDESIRAGALTIMVTGAEKASVSADLFARPRSAQPAIAFSPAILDFGTLGVLESKTLEIAVRSTGNEAATVTGYQLEGTSDYALLNAESCTGSLEPGMECLLRIRLTPTSATTRSGVLRALAVLPEPAAPAALTGSGIAGALSVTPASLHFLNAYPEEPQGKPVLVSNTGTVPVTVSSRSISGSSAAQFSSNGCLGSILQPEESCEVYVEFLPKITGEATAQLMLAHTGEGGMLEVPLFASVVTRPVAQPVLSLFDCPPVSTGEPAQCQAVLRNVGAADFSVTGLYRTGSAFAEPANNCPTSLVPGAQCLVQLGGIFENPGTYQTTVTAVTSAGIVEAVAVQTVAGPDSELLPPAFGTVRAGGFVEAPAVLRNRGSAGTLALSNSPFFTGDPAISVGTSTCATELTPDAQCQITLRCTPANPGAYSGTLSVPTNAGTFTAPVMCVADPAPAPVANLSEITCPIIYQGTQSTCSGTLTNSGNAPLSIGTPARSGAAFGEPAHTCGASLAAGSVCALTLTQTFVNSGTFSTTLAWQLGGAPFSREITATVTGPALALTGPGTGITQVSVPLDQTATLTNTGAGPASVSSASVTGAGFSLLSSTCPEMLAAGSSCAFATRCEATLPAIRTGTLSVSTGAGVKTVPLSCDIRSADVSVSRTTPSLNVGTGSQSGNWVTLTNNGVGPVTIEQLIPDAPNFSLYADSANNGHCGPGRVLVPGQSCQVLETVLGTALNGAMVPYRSSNLMAVRSSGGTHGWVAEYNVFGVAINPFSAPAKLQKGETRTMTFEVLNQAPHALEGITAQLSAPFLSGPLPVSTSECSSLTPGAAAPCRHK